MLFRTLEKEALLALLCLLAKGSRYISLKGSHRIMGNLLKPPGAGLGMGKHLKKIALSIGEPGPGVEAILIFGPLTLSGTSWQLVS